MLREQTGSKIFRRLAWIQRNSWLVSTASQAGQFVFFALLSIASTIGVYYTSDMSGVGCSLVHTEFVLIIVQGAIAMLLLLIASIFLWGISDAYLIKPELAIVLFTGVPVLILWGLGETLHWTPSAILFIMILEFISILATIWLPLLASFRFSRLLVISSSRKAMKSSASFGDTGSVSSTSSFDDEFRFVMIDSATLLPMFEK